jgi:hypothetical protein
MNDYLITVVGILFFRRASAAATDIKSIAPSVRVKHSSARHAQTKVQCANESVMPKRKRNAQTKA